MIASIASGIIVNLLTWLAKKYGGKEAIEMLAERFDISLKEYGQREVTYEIAMEMKPWLEEKVREDYEPIDEIFELEDDPLTTYIWVFKDEVPDEQVNGWQAKIRNEFIDKYSREPNALHVFGKGLSQMEEMPPEEVQEVVQPWLQDAKAFRDEEKE